MMISKGYLLATSTLLFVTFVLGQQCQEKNQCVNPNKAINPNDYACIGVGKWRIIKEDDHCVKHTCVQVEEDGKDVIKIEKTYGCKNGEGQCKFDGVRWKDMNTCTTYQCAVTLTSGYHIEWKIVKRECSNPLYAEGSGQYRCIGENKSIQVAEKCSKYTCSAVDNDGKIIMTMQQTFYGCRVNGECVLENGVRKDADKCLTQVCEIEKINATHYVSKMAVKNFGCRYEDTCYDDGETHRDEERCVTRVCEVIQPNTTYHQSSMIIQEQGCRYNGKCFAEGEESKDNCVIRECQVDHETRTSTMSNTNLECKDNIDGNCYADGSMMPYKDTNTGNMFECQCKVIGSPPLLASKIADCKFVP